MLNSETLREGLITDIVAGMSAASASLQESIYSDLSTAQLPSSIQTALVSINTKARAVQEEIAAANGDPNDYVGAYRDIVAKELGSAVSKSIADTLSGDWAQSLADTIATAVAKRVDAYVKEAKITVPKGQAVSVTMSGPSAGNGQTSETATATVE